MTTGVFLLLCPLHLVVLFESKQAVPKVQILVHTAVGAILYSVLGSISISFALETASTYVESERLAAGALALLTGLTFLITSSFGFFHCYSTSSYFVPYAEAVLQDKTKQEEMKKTGSAEESRRQDQVVPKEETCSGLAGLVGLRYSRSERAKGRQM